MTVDPERKPGARRLHNIREKIESLHAKCVFGEPQFSNAYLRIITEDTDVREGALDPLGADLPAGPDQYFTLMRGLADSLTDCLLGSNSE